MIQKDLFKLYRQCRLFIRQVTSLVPFKHQCCFCRGKSTQRICPGCQADFLSKAQYSCQCCGLPLEHPSPLCGNCITARPNFDQTYCPFLYKKPLSDILLRFKEQGDSTAGKALAELFAREIQQHYQQEQLPLPDLLVAVPLDWKKQWQRGFNQSLFLSHEIKHLLGIPIATGIKKVSSNASDQKLLSRIQRIHNVNSHFKVTKTLTGKHVVIVDDVMTTGATANALAKQLKLAGANYVTVWALARTP